MLLPQQYWLRDDVHFDPEVVESIYNDELLIPDRERKTPAVSVLELSQYLEKYLWPHFDVKSSKSHIMSIAMMVNEKMRLGVAPWTAFSSQQPESFPLFFEALVGVADFTNDSEQLAYVIFIKNAFQSLENELIRVQVLKLVSLPLWHSLSPGRLELELHAHPELVRHWKHLAKKEAKAAKASGDSHIPITQRMEATFIPRLLYSFTHAVGAEQSIALCRKLAECTVDILSQLPSRRFTRALIEDKAILIKAKLSRYYSVDKTFCQLVDMAIFYLTFPIADHSGDEVTEEEMVHGEYERLQQLQRLFFKHWPQLKELALCTCGYLAKKENLRKDIVEVLSTDELKSLVVDQLRLVSSQDVGGSNTSDGFSNKELLAEVLYSAFTRRQSQTELISQMPLYPTEQLLLDEDSVPMSGAPPGSLLPSPQGDDAALALPKLNLQFLTIQDYLLRNFHLFRLEAAYEIRNDIADALTRLGPYVGGDGSTAFAGWSRMALPLSSFAVTEVQPPKVGVSHPASVTAHITIDLLKAHSRADVRAEWDALGQHDVLFLLSLAPTHFEPVDSGKKLRGHGDIAKLLSSHGLVHARGCEILEVRDAEGALMNDATGGRLRPDEWQPPKGSQRSLIVSLDPSQYHADANTDVYTSFTVLLRRKSKENNFKAVLESIRDLMAERHAVPPWLHDILLGYGDPAAATYQALAKEEEGDMQGTLLSEPVLRTVDFKDTFLDAEHVQEAFGSKYDVRYREDALRSPPYKITFSDDVFMEGEERPGPGEMQRKGDSESKGKPIITVEPYSKQDPGPYPQDIPPRNAVRFTSVQISAILSGVQPGLSMIVGPPGTGKTDTAVQILHLLFHNRPTQRTLIITHSNQALNDIFQKLTERDVPARYLLRLGMGEKELETEEEYSRVGRVNAMLARRLELLSEVERLAKSLLVPDASVQYTCESAHYFYLLHVLSRWEKFLDAAGSEQKSATDAAQSVAELFPFKQFFSNAPQPLFTAEDFDADMDRAKGCFHHLRVLFQELEEIRPFEVLQSHKDRVDYLLTKQAKIIAMTCTHAALKRREFVKLDFKFDNLLMEEAAQVLEIETFIPMLLQRPDSEGRSRLKRTILIGDHHQLPPVVKNLAIQKFSKMDQSMFTRFIRLGTPAIQLNAQGRCRPSIAALYSWRYDALGNLPSVLPTASNVNYARANPGFALEYQFIDVSDYNGKGETQPIPYFYQNLGEAEFVVSVYAYMRLIGYPRSSISILTTYNGQKALIQDIVEKRCAKHPLMGRPAVVTTVDKYQGQQNQYVLLSLVRTHAFGHLRDVRRLVVALSRAQLGLYIFGRGGLFSNCFELRPAFKQLLSRPVQLALLPHERCDEKGSQPRTVEEMPSSAVVVEGVEHMAAIVGQVEAEAMTATNNGAGLSHNLAASERVGRHEDLGPEPHEMV